VTLVSPAPTRRFQARTQQAAPDFIYVPDLLPKSPLDLVLDRLARDHTRHATGPIFPCPLCFDPPFHVAR